MGRLIAANVEVYVLQKMESTMKVLAALLILIALAGCVDDRRLTGRSGSELAHKCMLDPYNYDCLHPPAVFHN